MFLRVPFRPQPWKRSSEAGSRVTYDGEGTENDLLLQIEVVKRLTSERRERIRFLASILDRRSMTRPYDEGLIARLGRQFGLQRLQIKIILETTEDDMVDDTHLRKIVGLDDSGRRIVHADLQFKPQT